MGFLDPRNLTWALALAVLALIYLRSRSRPTIEVSSLMLFDEVPAPVASVRHVRIDPLFWLEVAALTALVLAVAGLYAMEPARAGHGRSHALVFDLGAGMSARQNDTSSLGEAKQSAHELIDVAPLGDEFSVITYALEAQVRVPQTQNLDAVRKAIDNLRAFAVPAHASALAAAMMRARGSSEIELFTDRPPSPRAIGDARMAAQLHVHRVAHGDDNVAVVSLDPGIVGSSKGRGVLRNFSVKPRLAEVAIELDGREVYHETLIFAPREQVVVPFGPLLAGGLLTAHILTPDAIAADNQRWVYAPSVRAGRALVLSPDASVRDDLARVLLAINPNFQIETADPAKYTPDKSAMRPFEVVVMHDCYLPGVPADSMLLIYPPARVPPTARIPGLVISDKISPALLGNDRNEPAGDEALVLAHARVLTLPEWMEAVAVGSRPGDLDLIPLAAIGRIPGGRIGILAFDIRDHLLLDPDRLDALVVAVGLIKRLTTPDNVQIVPTGSFASVPVVGPAQVTSPDGSNMTVAPDKWGRVRLRPLEAGRYEIAAGGKTIDVFANYYDASESDLASIAVAPEAAATSIAPEHVSSAGPRQVQPLLLILAALALGTFFVESAILARHAARRWGLRHV
ncbi:MAG: BatA domain-containing protein [Candidatus Binataceae bacterium]